MASEHELPEAPLAVWELGPFELGAALDAAARIERPIRHAAVTVFALSFGFLAFMLHGLGVVAAEGVVIALGVLVLPWTRHRLVGFVAWSTRRAIGARTTLLAAGPRGVVVRGDGVESVVGIDALDPRVETARYFVVGRLSRSRLPFVVPRRSFVSFDARDAFARAVIGEARVDPARTTVASLVGEDASCVELTLARGEFVRSVARVVRHGSVPSHLVGVPIRVALVVLLAFLLLETIGLGVLAALAFVTLVSVVRVASAALRRRAVRLHLGRDALVVETPTSATYYARFAIVRSLEKARYFLLTTRRAAIVVPRRGLDEAAVEALRAFARGPERLEP